MAIVKRIYASTVGTLTGIISMPFLVLERTVKGAVDTVIDTVEAPVDSIKNKEFIEAPFDMVNTAVSGAVDTVADTVKTALISPVTVGAQVYCALAGEDANPRTVRFVERNK